MISKNLIKYIRSLEQKKIRDREGLFVAEGPKVVGDIMAAYAPARIIATPEWFGSHAITPKAADAVVSEEELRKIKESRKEQEADAPAVGKDKSSDKAKKPPAGKTEHKQPPKRKKPSKSKGAR